MENRGKYLSLCTRTNVREEFFVFYGIKHKKLSFQLTQVAFRVYSQLKHAINGPKYRNLEILFIKIPKSKVWFREEFVEFGTICGSRFNF